MNEAPSLPVDLLFLPRAGGSGPAVFQSLFTDARTYWLPGKTMGQRAGCPVNTRKAQERMGPALAGQGPLPPTHLLAHLSVTQRKPHQDGGVGELLFSTDVTCHKPSQPVPPSNWPCLSTAYLQV